jgi:hypothetical protein
MHSAKLAARTLPRLPCTLPPSFLLPAFASSAPTPRFFGTSATRRQPGPPDPASMSSQTIGGSGDESTAGLFGRSAGRPAADETSGGADEQQAAEDDEALPELLPAFRNDGTPVRGQDNLFHMLSRSPFQGLRDMAARIKKRAYCPVNLRDGVLKHVEFECPYCGFPTHASQKEWEEDDQHDRYWPRLREFNEDEHDLRSGRRFWEFEMPRALSLPVSLRPPS